MSRFTVANSLVLIGALGAGLAAMRDGSILTEQAVFTLLTAALFVSLVGAIVRRNDGAWAGFAVCGWGYALLTFVPPINYMVAPHLLTTAPLDALVTRLHPSAISPAPPQLNGQFMSMMGDVTHVGIREMTNSHRSLLSQAEQKALDRYQGQLQSYMSQQISTQQQVENAQRIGQELLSFVFAIIGALLGRILTVRSPEMMTSHPSLSGQTPPKPDR